MAGYVHCQLETRPDTDLVKDVAQVVLYHLFCDTDRVRNLAVSEAFPYQSCYLYFRVGVVD